MKNLKLLLALGLSLLPCITGYAAPTLKREIPTTTQFTRAWLTNENASTALAALGVSSEGFGGFATNAVALTNGFGYGTHTFQQVVGTLFSGSHVGDGSGLTGITESQVAGLPADLSSKSGTNESRAVIHTNAANVFRGASFTGPLVGNADTATLATNAASATNAVNATNLFGSITESQVTGLVEDLAGKAPTNRLALVWNPRDYGATGNNLAADSVGFANSVSNWMRFGGRHYTPAGTYVLTNQFRLPNGSTNGFELPYSDMEFVGDSMGGSRLRLALTNGVFLMSAGNVQSMRDISFYNAGSGNNVAYTNYSVGYPGKWQRVGFYGFKEGASIQAAMGFVLEDAEFETNVIGIRIYRYVDGVRITGRGSRNTTAPVVIGGYPPEFPEFAGVHAGFVRINGTLNGYNAIIAGNSRNMVVSGYAERSQRAAVALGLPLDLFPGETNVSLPQIEIRDFNYALGYSNEPLAELNTPVSQLRLNNVNGPTLVSITNATVGTSSKISFINAACSVRFMRFPVANMDIPSTPFADVHVDNALYIYGWNGTTTNLAVFLDGSGARFKGQVGVNSPSTIAPLNIQSGAGAESWMMVLGSTNGANVAKTARIGEFPYDGSTTPQTMFFGNVTAAGAATLNLGGGTSAGKPYSVVDFWAGGDPSTAYNGTNMGRFDTTGFTIQSGANNFLSLAASNHMTGPITASAHHGSGAALTVDASGFNGNLATTDNTAQEIAQKFDDFVSGGSGDNTNNVLYGNGTNAFQAIASHKALANWTNGNAAFELNNDTAAGGPNLLMRYYDSNVVAVAHANGLDLYARLGNLRLYEGGTDKMGFDIGLNTRRIIAGNGTDVAAEFVTYDAPIFGTLTYQHSAMPDGGFLYRNGTEIMGTTTPSFSSGSFATLVATNFLVNSNLPPATPTDYGQKYFWNSNGQGTIFVLSGNLNALTWNRTQHLADSAALNASALTSGIVPSDRLANGVSLTNLTYNLQTNAINTGVLPVGKTTFTNITGNITLGGFSGVDLNYNQWSKLWVTNQDTSPHSVTVAASIDTSTNTFVLAKAFWVTNASAMTISFDISAWGTNAAAVRWTR